MKLTPIWLELIRCIEGGTLAHPCLSTTPFSCQLPRPFLADPQYEGGSKKGKSRFCQGWEQFTCGVNSDTPIPSGGAKRCYRLILESY